MLWEEDCKDMINKISIKKVDVLLMYIRMPKWMLLMLYN